jgi:diacylglycerol O-acyltransferase / wax synthase
VRYLMAVGDLLIAWKLLQQADIATKAIDAGAAGSGGVQRSVAPALFRRQSKRATHNNPMNIAVSNVPGPRKRADVAGAPVCGFYSVGILSAGSALNITVWSYVDQLDISVLSDDRTFNDVHEATDALVHAFGEIRRAARLPGDPAVVDSAMAPAIGYG